MRLIAPVFATGGPLPDKGFHVDERYVRSPEYQVWRRGETVACRLLLVQRDEGLVDNDGVACVEIVDATTFFRYCMIRTGAQLLYVVAEGWIFWSRRQIQRALCAATALHPDSLALHFSSLSVS